MKIPKFLVNICLTVMCTSSFPSLLFPFFLYHSMNHDFRFFFYATKRIFFFISLSFSNFSFSHTNENSIYLFFGFFIWKMHTPNALVAIASEQVARTVKSVDFFLKSKQIVQIFSSFPIFRVLLRSALNREVVWKCSSSLYSTGYKWTTA